MFWKYWEGWRLESTSGKGGAARKESLYRPAPRNCTGEKSNTQPQYPRLSGLSSPSSATPSKWRSNKQAELHLFAYTNLAEDTESNHNSSHRLHPCNVIGETQLDAIQSTDFVVEDGRSPSVCGIKWYDCGKRATVRRGEGNTDVLVSVVVGQNYTGELQETAKGTARIQTRLRYLQCELGAS